MHGYGRSGGFPRPPSLAHPFHSPEICTALGTQPLRGSYFQLGRAAWPSTEPRALSQAQRRRCDFPPNSCAPVNMARASSTGGFWQGRGSRTGSHRSVVLAQQGPGDQQPSETCPGLAGLGGGTGIAASWGPPEGIAAAWGSATEWQERGHCGHPNPRGIAGWQQAEPPSPGLCVFAQLRRIWEAKKRARPLSKHVIIHESTPRRDGTELWATAKRCSEASPWQLWPPKPGSLLGGGVSPSRSPPRGLS